MQIKLNNKKITRSYINENYEWEFELANRTMVRFNKRIYPDTADVMLDGKRLNFNKKVQILQIALMNFI